MNDLTIQRKQKCCICGPVRNCGEYLDQIFINIEKIGELFHDYAVIMYYDESDDSTLQKIIDYQEKNKKFMYYINTEPLLPYRTHRIAKARNYCLNIIREKYPDFEFFIMMDCDDVNCKKVNAEILAKYLNRSDWDALSFQTDPEYYDIWALSIRPFNFSYNHFNNSVEYYYIMQKYVTELLNKLNPGELLPCISAFNGFAIYRTSQFTNCFYDGLIRLDLYPKHKLIEHIKAANSKIIFQKYEKVDGLNEDCEHRPFHVQGIQKNNAKIRISPEILFR